MSRPLMIIFHLWAEGADVAVALFIAPICLIQRSRSSIASFWPKSYRKYRRDMNQRVHSISVVHSKAVRV